MPDEYDQPYCRVNAKRSSATSGVGRRGGADFTRLFQGASHAMRRNAVDMSDL
jgi:hypothetical protein